MRRPWSLGRRSFFDYTARVRAQLHRFLLLLLMLALPLQAFASASAMLGCTGSHPAAAEHAAMTDEMMAACHDHKQSDSAPVQHDCKHCAACALAAALPVPAAAASAIMPTATRFIPYPAASFSGFIPDGPERPPRVSLAEF
jgi:hypothetical protein